MRVSLKERELPSGRRSLYLDIRQRGKKRRREGLNLMLTGDRLADRETKKRAQAIRDLRFKELHNLAWGTDPGEGRKASFFDYADAMARERRVRSTRIVWEKALRHFRAHAGADATFGVLDPETMRGFKSYLLDRMRESTARLYFQKINAVLKRAVVEEKLPRNPAAGITFKTARSTPVYLELAEVKLLAGTPLAAACTRNAFLFSCFTGLRFSDVAALRRGQIDGERLKFIQQKTQDVSWLPLSGEALRILGDQLSRAEGDRVFPLPAETVVNLSIKRWGKRAGIKKHFTYHASRHTFAMMLLQSGTDIYTVSKLLGHRSISTTQIYAHVIDDTKRAAIDRLPTL